jgi:hypothetical protein
MLKTHDRINPCSSARLKLSSDSALERPIHPLLRPNFWPNQSVLIGLAHYILGSVSGLEWPVHPLLSLTFLTESINCSTSSCVGHNSLIRSLIWVHMSISIISTRAIQWWFPFSLFTHIRNKKQTDFIDWLIQCIHRMSSSSRQNFLIWNPI